MGLSVGKNFDRTGALGPELVTADELPAGCKGLHLTTRVNGEVRKHEDLGHMHWDVAELIHFMSRVMELCPGDILTTRTPQRSEERSVGKECVSQSRSRWSTYH